MNENGLILIRNSDFGFDSRMKREANAALKIGMDVIVLGWIRDGSSVRSATIELKYGHVRVTNYCRKAEFGKGFRNIINIFLFNVWVYRQLTALRNHYRIILACDLDTVLPAYIDSKVHRKKVMFDIVDNYAQNHPMPRLIKWIVGQLENKMISIVDAVIVCNEIRFTSAAKAMPKKCIVVHNSPDMSSTSKARGRICKRDNANFKVVYVGTLTPYGRLLSEIIEASQRYPAIELHIAGIGPLAVRINELAQENPNIVFYGQLQNEQALQLQSECDLLFATYDPSIDINKYSAPLKLYEAMALRKPIIVCKGSTSDEITLHYGMGLVIEYDANEFWDAAISLSRNRALCKQMGRGGRKAYDGEFDWEIMEKRLTSLYRTLLASEHR